MTPEEIRKFRKRMWWDEFWKNNTDFIIVILYCAVTIPMLFMIFD